MHIHTHHGVFLPLITLLMLLVNIAGAQTPPEDENPSGVPSASDTVKYHYPPVITIGTRTPEPWIEVPLSVSYLQMKDLPKGKGYGLDEVLSGIPGVLVQSRFGNQDVRLTIRGFGARGAGERSNAGTTRGVRILNNGFPDTEPDGRTSFDLIDLSGAGGIEVIRSNASSIYGNASGGVINVMSNTQFDSPYVSYGEAFGSFGFRKEMINAGANLGTGKMYFSLSNTNSDGWRYQSRSSQLLLNTGVVANLGDRTTLGVHLSGTSNVFRIPGPLSQSQFDSLAQQADSLYIKRDERRNNRLGRIGITATHELDDNNMIGASAFVQPKYLQRSERGTFRDFNRYHVGGSAIYKNTAPFGSDNRNSLLIGVDEAYQDGAILFYTLSAQAARSLPLRDNKREGANNFGAFVQDEISIGDRWVAILGGRYDNITYYSESFINLKLHDTKSFTRFTPKAGITYRVSGSQSIYANLGGGVEVPAGNETDPIGTFGADTVFSLNPLLEPIYSTTIEVGTKHILPLGGDEPFANLIYDVAAYWLQVKNDIIPYRNGRFYFTAGRTERMGVEVGGTLQFNMGLTANVAFTFSNNKYKEYAIDSVHYGKPGAIANYANNKVVGIPDVFYTIGLKYGPRELRGAFIGAGVQNVGKYFADDANKITVPSYTVLNANIGVDHLTFANDMMYVSAFVGVNNLTDKKYIGSAWLNPDIVGGKPVYIEPGLPRNVVASLSLGYTFN
jgi:iron complex outermembrane receptor protein